ncbi:MAG: Na+/H+ antiporter NhaA [Chloroflexia bacterium]
MAVRTNQATRTGPPLQKLLYPIIAFMQAEVSGGVVLIAAAVMALAWANSPWSGSYDALWATKITIGPTGFQLSETLLHWVNDGLMAIFFFVVGLEIKREVLIGELASPRQAALPIAAALGGMVVPALLYAALTVGREGTAGWGIPMATDIAFALGVLALLGSRVPIGLRIFLTALAIVDDLGAVLVIALFYTAQISWAALAVALLFLLALVAINRLGVRHPPIYLLLGLGLWVAFLKSGIHATIAGVLLALTIPARTRCDTAEFFDRAHAALRDFDQAGEEGRHILTNAGQQAAVQELEALAASVQTPLQRLEHALHPWVAFAVVPIFALANAGVALGNGASLAHPVTLGVAVGLVFGKQIGIIGASWLIVRAGRAELPDGVTWRHIYGASLLGGIGFTMALFIASLAFGGGPLLDAAKLGTFGASLLAGLAGWAILRTIPATTRRDPLAAHAP